MDGHRDAGILPSGQQAGVLEQIRSYKYNLKHVTLLFIVLLIFQLAVSILHKTSLSKFLSRTQDWYQQDSAERLANLTTTSLELLLEGRVEKTALSSRASRKMVQGLNIILSQQLLNQNVREICILVPTDNGFAAIDDGSTLFDYMFADHRPALSSGTNHAGAIAMYRGVHDEMRRSEQIRTVLEGKQTFHVFVPFVPHGEYMGTLYMKNTPDFGLISREIITNYDEIALTFSALILFGLLAMFYISSYTLKQRNDAQQRLFQIEKDHLAEQIHYEKELLFTKRIYHTHHKAEKVMGFIKEDLRSLSAANIEEVKNRVTKYSNFMARVIYDMKWFDPPVQTVRSPLFHTSINDVIRFLIRNVFQRVASTPGAVRFDLQLDANVPAVPVNEFVVWEAIEPIIQNCVDHGGVPELTVTVTTTYDAAADAITVTIADNGAGIPAEMLQRNDRGVKRLFLERVSTKSQDGRHTGYGCYIAHEIATQRCGWSMDAGNNPAGGARFTFTILHIAQQKPELEAGVADQKRERESPNV